MVGTALHGRDRGLMRRRRKAWEKRTRGGACCLAQFLEGASLDPGNRLGNVGYMGRFTPFAAVGYRGQIRAVCFQHEAVQRQTAERVSYDLSIFKGQDAGEADPVA